MDTYVQGSNTRLLVDVAIFNAGEDAFESEFFLYLPPTLSFINTDRNKSNGSILCSPPDEDSDRLLRCDIGNPLPSLKSVFLRIYLQPVPDVTRPDRTISLTYEANSTNKEEPGKLSDNRQSLNLGLQVNTTLLLGG